jgi:hypothetical protein
MTCERLNGQVCIPGTVYRGEARTGDGAGAALESPRGTAGGNTTQVLRQNCQKTQETAL